MIKAQTLQKLKALRDCSAASVNEKEVAGRLIEKMKPNREHSKKCLCQLCFLENVKSLSTGYCSQCMEIYSLLANIGHRPFCEKYNSK